MSRTTPHKRGHRRGPSSGRIGASDYESDAYNMDSQANANPPVYRDNNTLNRAVLARHIANLSSIKSIVPHAVIYAFLQAAGEWDKTSIEGVLFVCDTELPPPLPSFSTTTPSTTTRDAVLFVFNRRGLHNFSLPLSRVEFAEVAGALLILRFPALIDYGCNDVVQLEADDSGYRTMSIWLHAEQDEDRAASTATILDEWRRVRAAHAEAGDENGNGLGPVSPSAAATTENSRPTQMASARLDYQGSTGPAPGLGSSMAGGRQLSVAQLFANGSQTWSGT